MIERSLKQSLVAAASHYPIISVEGPRGSGKTHLVRNTLSYEYVDMENVDIRDAARRDPRGFLYQHYDPTGSLVIDEIHRLPALLPTIVRVVANKPFPGSFILTSSVQLEDSLFNDTCCRMKLFPLSSSECAPTHLRSLDKCIFHGAFPAVFLGESSPSEYYQHLIHTFLEKELPHQLKITDPEIFLHFLRLLAGRIGQMINFSSLGDEVGVSHNTARAWIALLQKNYIIHLLNPYPVGFGKRVVKTPKLYFWDTGLASWLLGLRSADQLMTHYLKAKLFECWVISDLIKEKIPANLQPQYYFWRDKLGAEISCLIKSSDSITPIVIRSGRTATEHYSEPLKLWHKLTGCSEGRVIYAGDENSSIDSYPVASWKQTRSLLSVYTARDSKIEVSGGDFFYQAKCGDQS